MASGDSLYSLDWRATASKDWRRLGHQLDALLDDAVRFDRSLEIYRSLCERVAAYYFAERYPQLQATGLTATDLEVDREEGRWFMKGLFPDEQLS